MTLHANDDLLYIHGGYSREKKAVNAAAGYLYSLSYNSIVVMMSDKHMTGGQQQKKASEGVVHQVTLLSTNQCIITFNIYTLKLGHLDDESQTCCRSGKCCCWDVKQI